MKNKSANYLSLISIAILLSACQPQDTTTLSLADVSDPEAAVAVPVEVMPVVVEHQLVALPGKETEVPVITQKTSISMQTTGGEIIIEVYPEAAPNAAARFIELTETGFYTDTPISRVVSGFVAQFGVNWREPHKSYQENLFDDDPTLFSLDRGTLAFAKAGPNTNSTQVFINFQNNNRLASPEYNFTVFGKVVQGMDVVDSFLIVGDPNGGLDQGRLWDDGAAYLESLVTKPTMIESVQLIE